MYFPYLRGKQYELITLRELAQSLGENDVIHPIIEPVRESISTLRLTNEELQKNKAPFTIIINPQVGDFKSSDDHDQVIEFINQNISNYEKFYTGIILNTTTNLQHISSLLDNLDNKYSSNLIHIGRFPDMEELNNFIDDHVIINYNLFRDIRIIRRYRRIINNRPKVILDDPFNEQRTNADYADIPDEFFSDEYNYFQEDGFAGFGDYVTIGENYSDSGFAPYAVVIHLTYEKNNEQIWIRHFVSDSNEDYSDVAGTYREALEKLIEFIDKNDIHSEACEEFREHFSRRHYPGLGSIKKLSIKHHLELITNILKR